MSQEQKTHWTEAEVESLRIYFENGYSDIEISEALGRSDDAVRYQRYRHGLMRSTNGKWCKAALDTLLDPANADLTNRAMGELLGIDDSNVHRKRRELGLKTRTRRRWTEDEISILRQYYPLYGTAAVAKRTGWDAKAIENKVYSLGIKRMKNAS